MSPTAPADFCAAAAQAAEGNIAFSDPVATARLTEHEGLSEAQRGVISTAVEATRREIERAGEGGAWSNDEMVAAVNALCGPIVTAVSMQP